MKKILSILLAIISTICITFAFVGCGTVEVSGSFYTIKQAYDNGWLNEDDLKSIACGYYEFFQFSVYTDYENLYSGMFDPHEELSKTKEKELKQAYLVQIVKAPDSSIDGVEIAQYYGTYNENIVVGILSDYIKADKIVEEKFIVGNIVFNKFCEGDILVYHIN